MANLTAERALTRRNGPPALSPAATNDFANLDPLGLPIAASAAKMWAGCMVALDATQGVVHAAAASAVRCIGVANETKDNSAGALGDLKMPTRQGVYQFANSGAGVDLLAIGDINTECYVADNQTVAKTPGSLGARIPAGVVRGVDSGGVWVEFGGAGGAADDAPVIAPEVYGARVVRCCIHTNLASLASFTVAARDGLTLVEGDRVVQIGRAHV